MTERSYLVVPFERIGNRIGARHMLVFDAAGQARNVASQLAERVSGVAVLERAWDE